MCMVYLSIFNRNPALTKHISYNGSSQIIVIIITKCENEIMFLNQKSQGASQSS